MAQTRFVQKSLARRDPRKVHKKAPFPAQRQPFPGYEKQLQPAADHGEESYKGHNRLEGKVALITGGDSGIGRAVAIAFSREGADVAISCLPQEEQDAKETIRWVEQAGKRALFLPGDIQKPAHCAKLVENVISKLGHIDILVNNAAFQMTHDEIQGFTDEEFDRTVRTNLYAMFYLCRAAVPRMKEGGVIINTASIQAFDPSPNLLPYAMTKGAIVTFTKALAKMVIQQGIRANAVAPGPVWTPLIPYSMPQKKIQNFGTNTPLERTAQPAELAPLYVFLASTESTYVTGEVFGATGGQTPA